MTRLADLAEKISSKNAGAFVITFDVVFEDAEVYQRVKESGAINAEAVAALFGMDPDQVLRVIEFDQGNAFKVAVRRIRPSGGIGETDVFGAQQYAPLLDLDVPVTMSR